jgi:hypothetical protein
MNYKGGHGAPSARQGRSADAFLLNISLHDDVFLKDIESEPVQLVKK